KTAVKGRAPARPHEPTVFAPGSDRRDRDVARGTFHVERPRRPGGVGREWRSGPAGRGDVKNPTARPRGPWRGPAPRGRGEGSGAGGGRGWGPAGGRGNLAMGRGGAGPVAQAGGAGSSACSRIRN